MRFRWGFRGSAAAAAGLVCAALACQSGAPADAQDEVAPPPIPEDRFSGQKAWEHLEALVAIGDRPSGSSGAERAAGYLRQQLGSIGAEDRSIESTIELEDAPPLVLDHVVGVLPGASEDAILLVAHYDTPDLDFDFAGANTSGSASALVLEMGRALSKRERPYTIWLVFVDGEALMTNRGEFGLGARLLTAQLAQDGVLARARLAVVYDQVGDADLVLSRDLRSHRAYREVFWDVARDLGHESAFDPSLPFESPYAPHRAFIDEGLRRVVALVDVRYGGEEPPGVYWLSEDDNLEHCSVDSLQAVGDVSLAALDRIAARLQKIDRFSRSRQAEEPSAAPVALEETRPPHVEEDGADAPGEPAP